MTYTKRADRHHGTAGILTLPAPNRRVSDAAAGVSGPIAGFIAALTVLLASGGGPAAASEWQSTDSITGTAEAFVKSQYGSRDDRVVPVAGHLDPRLRLPRCDEPLQAFVRRGTRVSSRTIVGVRCSGSKPWKVYVPVDVAVTESVLVAKTALAKGHALTPGDVVTERRDVALFRNGYLTSVGQLADRRLKRPVEAGRVITPSMLVADVIVRRGQAVTLMVDNNHINIRMSGRALSDGVLNQRIRVENMNSGRVVEGIVRSPEHVEILVR